MENDQEEQPEFAPGDTVGTYQVVRLLGGGAFGEVYEAVNKLGARVAIKTLRRPFARRQELRARFMREGLTAVKIHHPNAVQALDIGEQGEVPYLVLEFLNGEDLEARLTRTGLLSPMAATDILLPVLAALVAAHEEGVIHRDLKPANVFLAKTRDGEVVPKVVDFGISRLKDGPMDGVLTRDGALMGSPAYMSPEQTRGARDVTEASDQFSMGSILYECVTGQRAFNAPSLMMLLPRIARADFPPPRKVKPDLPVEFEQVILRAMAPEPAQRYANVRAFGEALLPFASNRVRSNMRRVFDPLGSSTVTSDLGASTARPSVIPRSSVPIEMASTLGGAAASIDTAQTIATQGSRRFPGVLAAGVVVLLGVLGGGAVWVRHTMAASQGPAMYQVAIEAVPLSATIRVDGRQVAAGRFIGAFARDGHPHQLSVTAEGFQPYETTFVDVSPDRHVRLQPNAPAAPDGTPAPASPTAPVAGTVGPLTPAADAPGETPAASAHAHGHGGHGHHGAHGHTPSGGHHHGSPLDPY